MSMYVYLIYVYTSFQVHATTGVARGREREGEGEMGRYWSTVGEAKRN